jgi:hypothetical protein
LLADPEGLGAGPKAWCPHDHRAISRRLPSPLPGAASCPVKGRSRKPPILLFLRVCDAAKHW